MRVAVTGGAGFIGHHLVAELLRRGHTVRVLDTGRRHGLDRPQLAGAEVMRGDVQDPEACAALLRGCEAVVHLAAASTVMESHHDPNGAFAVNVAGTWNVLAAAREHGAQHLVFASSREVYGEPEALPVPEDAPLRAKNAYGASKIAGEALLAARPPGSPATSVLRLANVVGPGDRGRVVPRWIEAARRGEPLVLYGGNQEIDFVPVDMVVGCFVRLIEGGPADAPVNVGGGRATTLRDLAERIRATFASAAPVEVRPPRGPEVERFRADVTRMRDVLGIEPPGDPLRDLEQWAGAGAVEEPAEAGR